LRHKRYYLGMENITELVERTGLARADVARALGVSVAMLRNYERGINRIPDARLGTLQALAGGRITPAAEPAPVAPTLALVPASDLIAELDRRARAGQLRDTITRAPGRDRDRGTKLRAVASDLEDED
jgi:transcriptional regulator with XRE-family HTH domain